MFKRPFTVWEFESATTGERIRVAHARYPDDHKYAHAFQRIIAQVDASTKDEALRLASLTPADIATANDPRA